MYKILIYGDTNWSVGSVHKNIAKYLKNDFEFVFYDWGKYNPIDLYSLFDQFDIIFTNLITLEIFQKKYKSLSKFNEEFR